MVTEVVDYVSIEDSPDSVTVSDSTDAISVVDDSGNSVQVTEVVEALNVSDSIDALVVSDAVDAVENVSDAHISIHQIIVESESEMPLSKEVDFVGDTIIYKGYAQPNTGTDAPAWKIEKLEFVGVDGDVVMRWADSGLFTQIWDDRATLIYV